jgi:hypothetical protein
MPPKKNKQNKNKKKKNGKSTPAQPNPRNRAPYTPGQNQKVAVRRGNPLSRVKQSVHQKACGISDPFCIHARCAKWPDGQGAGTVAFQIRGRRQMATNTTNWVNGALTQFTGDLPFSYLTTTTNDGSNWTMAAAYVDLTVGTGFTTYADSYRIVSWGVIVRNVQPATNAQGTVIVRKLNTQLIPSATFANANMYGGEVAEYPVYPGMEIAVIGKTQGNSSRSFIPQNTSTTISNGKYWDTIHIELVNGYASASTVLEVEYVYNVEFQVKTSQIAIHEFVPQSAPIVPHLTNAANTVMTKGASILEGGVQKAGAAVLSRVEDFFEQAGTDLLAALF